MRRTSAYCKERAGITVWKQGHKKKVSLKGKSPEKFNHRIINKTKRICNQIFIEKEK